MRDSCLRNVSMSVYSHTVSMFTAVCTEARPASPWCSFSVSESNDVPVHKGHLLALDAFDVECSVYKYGT